MIYFKQRPFKHETIDISYYSDELTFLLTLNTTVCNKFF